MAKRSGDPLFVIKLQKGLADRKRLPLSHVLTVLDELRQLITEIGRDMQRKKGIANATGDFGLEIIAGDGGIVFRPGSVQASIALTERAGTGVRALEAILQNVELLESDDFVEESVDQQVDRRVVRRLSRIARIQKQDRTVMQLGIVRTDGKKSTSATFGSNAIAAVRSLQTPTFHVDNTVMYGRITELIDRTTSDDEEERGFWGELRADDGEEWRIQFMPEDLPKATPLFKRQVKIEGTAVYFRIARPKLICKHIDPDVDRDYDAAFDELYGCNKELYKADLNTLLKNLHGD